jgi:hypothetical protein
LIESELFQSKYVRAGPARKKDDTPYGSGGSVISQFRSFVCIRRRVLGVIVS